MVNLPWDTGRLISEFLNLGNVTVCLTVGILYFHSLLFLWSPLNITFSFLKKGFN